MKIDITQANRTQAAKVIGITPQHFGRLKTSGLFHTNPDGKTYSIPAVVTAWVDYQSSGKTDASTGEEKRKLIIAQRKKIELETREREKELLERSLVGRTFNEAMALIGAQLDAIPGRSAAELAALEDPAEVYDWLFKETRRVRQAAADALVAYAG